MKDKKKSFQQTGIITEIWKTLISGLLWPIIDLF
jgi:hypothetical protein